MIQLKQYDTFRSKHFKGLVTVHGVYESRNNLLVVIDPQEEGRLTWSEEWNLEHTLWGFEHGDYFELRHQESVNESDAKLDLQKFRQLSVQRAIEGFRTYDNVSILFFTTALAGELGELCNNIKKLERAAVGGLDAGTNEKAKDITTDKLKEEIGGIFIYLDLLASRLNISLEEAVIETFNSKSIKYGLKQLYQ